MFRWQFSFRALLFAVLVVGVALTALLSASDTAANAALTVHFSLLGLGIVGAVVRRGNGRVFWMGYSVFGCGYSVLVWGLGQSLLTDDVLRWVEGLRRHRVGARVQAQWTDGRFYPATIKSASNGQFTVVWDGGAPDSVVTAGRMKRIPPPPDRVGHAVLAPFVAYLGALAAVFFFGEREGPKRKVAEPHVVQ